MILEHEPGLSRFDRARIGGEKVPRCLPDAWKAIACPLFSSMASIDAFLGVPWASGKGMADTSGAAKRIKEIKETAFLDMME